MRGFVFVTKLWIFGLCWLSMSCSDKELSFSNIEDNSKVKFSSGTKSGVVVNSSGNLTIDTGSLSGVNLDSSWTPKYDNIVGYWKMDGDWTDSSGNGNDAVSMNSATFSSEDKIVGTNSGYFSNGTSDYALVANNYNLTRYSVSFWAKPSSIVVGAAAVASPATFVQIGGGANPWQFGCVVGTSSVVVGRWDHIAAVEDGGVTRIYVNGSEENSGSCGFVLSTINIGRRTDGVYFDGLVDDVAIWDEPLSASEVTEIYQKQRLKFSGELDSSWTPQYNNIVAYWKLDGNWLDSSGQGYDLAVISGDPVHVADGAVGYGAEFDGVGDYVRATLSSGPLNELTGSDDFSIAFWGRINPTQVDTGVNSNLILSMISSSVGYFARFFYINQNTGGSGNTYFRAYDGSTLVGPISSQKILDNGYHHFVGVKSGDNLYYYIDGAFQNVSSGVTVPGNVIELRVSNSSAPITGTMDEVAVWNSALSSSDVSTIYHRQKQKYSGTFTSHVFDFGTNGSWLGLDVITPLPFMKELPGLNGSESSAVYSDLVGSGGSIGDDDLMSELIGYWPLNESSEDTAPGGADAEDMSGNNNHGNISGASEIGVIGKFGMAMRNQGTLTEKIVVSSPSNLSYSSRITVMAWAKSSQSDYVAADGHILNRKMTNACSPCFNINDADDKVRFTLRLEGSEGTTRQARADQPIDTNWHHYVGVYDGATVKLYIDGVLQAAKTNVVGILDQDNTGNLYIGSHTNGGSAFQGLIDEVAIWSRALTSSEILQLYRRGANRLKYQVRSCAQSDCSDGEWKGPGGDGTTYYSELFNRLSSNFNFSCSLNTTDSDSSVCVDDEISFLGSPLVIAPSLLFRDMAGSATLDRNRYFQFKVLMESDDENGLCSSSPCLPELKSLKVRHGP